MIPFSVLDLSPIPAGATAADAFRHSLDLAQHAERWGFLRYWLAEHHNMTGIASAATSVVIGHIAGGTKTIRVGSGGVMLPNHAPLVIAEQFGTLASLYPGRIDLGLGRAPGTDQTTARAKPRVVGGGTRGRRAFARVLGDRGSGTGGSGPRVAHRADAGGRTDRDRADLRSRGAPAFLRDHRERAPGARRRPLRRAMLDARSFGKQ